MAPFNVLATCCFCIVSWWSSTRHSQSLYKYLGFYLLADLWWSYHMQCTCTKARKIMGILYWQFSGNVDSFILWHITHETSSWILCWSMESILTTEDIAVLENVQKFALRVCFKKWSLNYQDLNSQTVSSTISSRLPIIRSVLWLRSLKLSTILCTFHLIFFLLSYLLLD